MKKHIVEFNSCTTKRDGTNFSASEVDEFWANYNVAEPRLANLVLCREEVELLNDYFRGHPLINKDDLYYLVQRIDKFEERDRLSSQLEQLIQGVVIR